MGIAALMGVLVMVMWQAAPAACDVPLVAQYLQARLSKPLGLEGGLAKISCAECKVFANEMFEIGANATFRELVDAGINSSCPVLFPKSSHICDVLGEAVVNDLIPFIDKQLLTIAWDAQAFCSNFVPVCFNPCCATPTGPEKLRLSLTGRAGLTEMAVSWTTLQNTSTHTVQWGVGSAPGTPLPSSSNGWSRTYTHGGWIGIVHTAIMTDLEPGMPYTYRVGDANGGWSRTWNFTTLPTNAGTTQRPMRLLNIGDMGYSNDSDATVAALEAEIDAGTVDLLLHVGDVSYADGDMAHWDIYLQKVKCVDTTVLSRQGPSYPSQQANTFVPR